MAEIEGLIFSGNVRLTTDFGESKRSQKGTEFRAALARDRRGTTYRLFAFGEAILRQAREFRKGDEAAILGEVLSSREDTIGLAIKDIAPPPLEEEEEVHF